MFWFPDIEVKLIFGFSILLMDLCSSLSFWIKFGLLWIVAPENENIVGFASSTAEGTVFTVANLFMTFDTVVSVS
ncbi:hypothetical protein C8J55DRAFT_522727 [Lentinula edodes]|uniref:Uncharacterized protein n=1 Tax=Lentinula lateritia TaxID=40482 RepID=A0A9W9DI17_9AGAR|nr:hypothetical protein C8J55DRAFT_522727 [Lentinula edodes]